MKTRMKGKLNIEEFLDNLEFTSFLDLIKDEIKEKNKNLNKEAKKDIKEIKTNIENIYINNFVTIANFLQSYAKEINIFISNIYLLYMSK